MLFAIRDPRYFQTDLVIFIIYLNFMVLFFFGLMWVFKTLPIFFFLKYLVPVPRQRFELTQFHGQVNFAFPSPKKFMEIQEAAPIHWLKIEQSHMESHLCLFLAWIKIDVEFFS